MSNAENLDEILLRWEEAWDEGREISVAQLCQDYPELREPVTAKIQQLKKIKALLNPVDNLSGGVSRSLLTPSGIPHSTYRAVERNSELKSNSLPGDQIQLPNIPGYEISGLIGHGGLAVVYLARQLALNRPVALKMILGGGHASPEAKKRFLKEAETIAKLKHPNIVQIFDFGLHSGVPYFSLEYMEGGSLAGRIAQGAISTREAAQLMLAIAEGVRAAHALGVVHRDLKPENILLSVDGTPKVADFGLAKDNDSNLTMSGAVLGTPSYMAPEQASGEVSQIGPTTDVYGLGAILYFILTGQPPFRANTTWETIRQVLSTEVAPPSLSGKRIPEDLEIICLKCMEKSQAQRYQTISQLIEDLQRFLNGKPISAKAVSSSERFRRWCQRNPIIASSLAVTILTLVAGSALATYFGFNAEFKRREAVTAQDMARKQVVDLCTTMGLEAEKKGFSDLAALWFSRGVAKAQTEAEQHLNRVRITNWMNRVSRPVQCFSVPTFANQNDLFTTFDFHPSGSHLLMVLDKQQGFLWSLSEEKLVPFPENLEGISAAAWSENGQYLAVSTAQGRIRMFDFYTGQSLLDLPVEGQAKPISFDPYSRLLAWGESGGVQVWDRVAGHFASPKLLHPKKVLTIKFSPAGDRLVTSSSDKFARVFAAQSMEETNEPLLPPFPHSAGTTGVSHAGYDQVAPRFVDNGRILITVPDYGTVGRDAKVVWWNCNTAREISTVSQPGTSGSLVAMTTSPDDRFVTLAWDNRAAICSAEDGSVITMFDPPHDYPEDVAIDHGGTRLLTCGQDATVRIWNFPPGDLKELTEAQHPIRHPKSVVRARFSTDDRFLATAQWNGDVVVWKLPERELAEYSVSVNGTTRTTTSPDGKWWAPSGVSFRNGTLRSTQARDFRSGRAAGHRIQLEGILLDACFSTDSGTLFTAETSAGSISRREELRKSGQPLTGKIQAWDWNNGTPRWPAINTTTEPRSISLNSRSTLGTSVCADGWLLVFEPKTGEVLKRLDMGQRNSSSANYWTSNGSACFSPNDRYLITWGVGNAAQVWDAQTWEKKCDLDHQAWITSITFDRRSRIVMTYGSDNQVHFWDLSSGRQITQPLDHPRGVSFAILDEPRAVAISASHDGVIRSWDWREGKIRSAWHFHKHFVASLRMVPDSKWMVTAGVSETGFFDSETGTAISPIITSPFVNLDVQLNAAGTRGVVSGFERAVLGYDLLRIFSVSTESSEQINKTAELICASKIGENGELLPLSPTEWWNCWETVRPGRGENQFQHETPDPLLQIVAEPQARLLFKNSDSESTQQGDHTEEKSVKSARQVTFDVPLIPEDDFSLLMWVRPTKSSNRPITICQMGTSPTDRPLHLSLHGHRLNLEIIAGRKRRLDGLVLNPGQWSYLAAVKHGREMVLYIDGIRRGTCQVPKLNFTEAQSLVFGSQPGSESSILDFQIRDIEFWAGALSDRQISQRAKTRIFSF